MSKNEEPLTAEAVHERIIKYCQGRMCLTCKYSKLPGIFECPIHFIFDNYEVIKKNRKRKIYIVTYGEYSDYHICCVFSSLDKAEKYCARQNAKSPYDDDYFVEEYNVDNIKVAEDIKLYYEYRFYEGNPTN